MLRRKDQAVLKTLLAAALCLALFTTLAGCGSDSSGRSTDTFAGTLADTDWALSDTSRCDRYRCSANENGTGQVDLISEEFDPYLVVYAVSADGTATEIAQDNDSGDGLNARVGFDMTRGVTYEVRVLSHTTGTGAYTLRFSSNLGTITQIPDPTPSS